MVVVYCLFGIAHLVFFQNNFINNLCLFYTHNFFRVLIPNSELYSVYVCITEI